MGVSRRLSGHVGVARHLSGQSIKAGLRLSHADGQRTWTHVVNVTSLTDVIVISVFILVFVNGVFDISWVL